VHKKKGKRPIGKTRGGGEKVEKNYQPFSEERREKKNGREKKTKVGFRKAVQRRKRPKNGKRSKTSSRADRQRYRKKAGKEQEKKKFSGVWLGKRKKATWSAMNPVGEVRKKQKVEKRAFFWMHCNSRAGHEEKGGTCRHARGKC